VPNTRPTGHGFGQPSKVVQETFDPSGTQNPCVQDTTQAAAAGDSVARSLKPQRRHQPKPPLTWTRRSEAVVLSTVTGFADSPRRASDSGLKTFPV
jgi:hypothetical protein